MRVGILGSGLMGGKPSLVHCGDESASKHIVAALIRDTGVERFGG